MTTIDAPAVPPDAEPSPGRIIPHDNLPGVTADQAGQVRAQALGWITRTRRSRSAIARAIGVQPIAVSRFLNKGYCGDWRKIAWRIDSYMASCEASDHPGPTGPRRFVETHVARDVMLVADVTRHLGGIGLVHGPSGVGKTCALQHMVDANPAEVVLIRLETLRCSAAGVIESIARSLGLFPPSRRNIPTRQALHAVQERLLECPSLLLIDEAHKLMGQAHDKSLHSLRDLHDSTGTPIVLSSTTDLIAYLETEQGKGPQREPLAQIRRRIVVGRDLAAQAAVRRGMFKLEEIRRIFQVQGMKLSPDAAADLLVLANVHDGGHLGACVNVAAMAEKLAGGGTVTPAMIRDAASLLVNRRGLDRLQRSGRKSELRKAG